MQIRGNNAQTGALAWQAWGNTTAWSGLGLCNAITADAKHVFWSGVDHTAGAALEKFFVASQDALDGSDDWAHSGPSGSAAFVVREGDRIAAAGSRLIGGRVRCHLRVVEAVCSTHGTETVCPK